MTLKVPDRESGTRSGSKRTATVEVGVHHFKCLEAIRGLDLALWQPELTTVTTLGRATAGETLELVPPL